MDHQENGSLSIEELQRAYQQCRQADTMKDDLVQQMIHKVTTLENQLARLDTELDQQRMLVQTYYGKFKEADTELSTTKRKQEQANFTLALIDGDIMLFKDDYIKKGEQGGIESARELRSAMEEYLATINISSRVMVRIYANVSGLKKVYGSADIYGFIQGFNMFDGLYEIIDAGYGKECSDEKVKRTFELFIKTVQCNHIIFGGSGDNGYARLLGGYVGDSTITLLEGPPFERELAMIADQFQKTTFKNVFRSTKIELSLPIRNATTNTGQKIAPPPGLERVTSQNAPSPATNPAPPGAWTTIASKPPVTSQALAPAPAPTKKESKYPAQDGFLIFRNKHGQRVDEPIDIPRSEEQKIKTRKLCNNYHLFDLCDYGDSCYNTHGSHLSERDFLAQRALARRTPCRTGLECNDRFCSSGHQCGSGDRCIRNKCWFSNDMHDVDQKIVDTVKI